MTSNFFVVPVAELKEHFLAKKEVASGKLEFLRGKIERSTIGSESSILMEERESQLERQVSRWGFLAEHLPAEIKAVTMCHADLELFELIR